MKKSLKTKALAVFACAFALCFALVGCTSGGNAAGDDAAKNFQGDWVLSGGSSAGQEIDQASIDSMQQLGMNVYIQLQEDGTAVISLFGSEMTGTWKAKDATTADFTLEGDTEEIKIENDELVIEVDGDSLRFKRGEIPAAEVAATPDEEQSATPEA
ncbi:hypothetical protein PZH32_04235 [Adlercreutzia equolifaciens]|uniref:hypothetical protein n=1 Tax=Adlercreutzia equolifaciens TaxID=446660 RepID=UPI0023B18AAB|nr:hypothetical protein [Adlercreutzia equolifaciens]MDE8702169.1 hypothetical protein [Adlercreutzia equolifaciens]